MTTYNCICFTCEGSGKFQLDSELGYDELGVILCPNCGSEKTKVLGQVNNIFGKFDSMSPQEKQKVLKKRSNDHFKSKLKEKKEYLDRSAIGLTQ